MHNLAVVVGSLRKDSINKKLARNLMTIGKGLFNSTLLPLDDLPMFNQDMEAAFPPVVSAFKDSIRAADAVLFVTPEYNRSMPAVLKNALDWASRPYGDNAWNGKAAAVCGITPSAAGTAVSQSHLRSVLTILNLRLISQPEIYLTETPGFFTAEGDIGNDKTREFLLDFLKRFSSWTEQSAG